MKRTFSIVILAAGQGSRFGGSKLLAPYHNSPLISHVVDTARATKPGEIVLVVSDSLGDFPGVRSVVNPRSREGLSSSIKIGLDSLSSSCERAVLLLGDQPHVSTSHVLALVESLSDDRSIAASGYSDGRVGVPAAFAKIHFGELSRLQGDHGAKQFLSETAFSVSVLPLGPGEEIDIDTPGDLEGLQD